MNRKVRWNTDLLCVLPSQKDIVLLHDKVTQYECTLEEKHSNKLIWNKFSCANKKKKRIKVERISHLFRKITSMSKNIVS